MNDISVEFHVEAEFEMLQAADFYESQEQGLEQRFLDDIDSGLKSILDHPKGWPVVTGTIRKKVLNRFPYTILYQVEDNHIFILAVMHQRRSPNYWKNRL